MAEAQELLEQIVLIVSIANEDKHASRSKLFLVGAMSICERCMSVHTMTPMMQAAKIQHTRTAVMFAMERHIVWQTEIFKA